VAFERFQYLVAVERFQWKVPMFGGIWKEKKKHLFHLFSLSPPTILFDFFFPLLLRFSCTMVLERYFMPFFLFPWPINYNHASWCTKSSTHSLSSWFWLKIFLFPFFEFMASHMTTYYGP
jgi:hypothetical protein